MPNIGLKPYSLNTKPAAAARTAPLSPAVIAEGRKLAFRITSAFEGGKPGSLQTSDSGIISYGKHQATLKSGSLYEVLRLYCRNSGSETARAIARFLPEVKSANPALRHNSRFLNLLKQAGSDPVMAKTQDTVFDNLYWRPVVDLAERNGLRSAAALAVLYDTGIQGGLSQILNAAKKSLHGRTYTEREFLNEFLNQRQKYLYNLAAGKRAKGDNKNARMLANSAATRIGQLRTFVLQSRINNFTH